MGGNPGTVSGFAHARCFCKLAGGAPIMAQRERAPRWESAMAYHRKHGIGTSPTWTSNECLEAKRRLATWGPTGGTQVFSLFCARIAGARGHHVHRGTGELELPVHPQA